MPTLENWGGRLKSLLWACRYLPEAAKKKARVNPAVAEMYTGTWTRKKTTGEPLGEPQTVLIKPVGFLSEREVGDCTVQIQAPMLCTADPLALYIQSNPNARQI